MHSGKYYITPSSWSFIELAPAAVNCCCVRVALLNAGRSNSYVQRSWKPHACIIGTGTAAILSNIAALYI